MLKSILILLLASACFGMSTFDDRMRDLDSRMHQLDHDMALLMTRQMEFMDVLDMYRPCEVWDTQFGSVATGVILTGISFIAAYLCHRCFDRRERHEVRRACTQLRRAVLCELRMISSLNSCELESPPSYDSLSCNNQPEMLP